MQPGPTLLSVPVPTSSAFERLRTFRADMGSLIRMLCRVQLQTVGKFENHPARLAYMFPLNSSWFVWIVAPTITPPTIAPHTIARPTIAPPTIAPPTIAFHPIAPPNIAPPTIAPPTIAPLTIAPPTIAPPTIAPPTIAPQQLSRACHSKQPQQLRRACHSNCFLLVSNHSPPHHIPTIASALHPFPPTDASPALYPALYPSSGTGRISLEAEGTP